MSSNVYGLPKQKTAQITKVSQAGGTTEQSHLPPK